jgi:UDP-N-acetylmuramoylalanine--D-glutamate ligase
LPSATFSSRLGKRRALVVGLARSGLAAARLLQRLGARVTACDRLAEIAGVEELRREGFEVIAGRDGPELLAGKDLLLLSPGVALDSPLCREASRKGIEILGELELGWRLLRERANIAMFAVTGTNGKSTTCALCAHLLRRAGINTELAGNIGRPLCQLLLEDSRPRAAVVEVSSYQLEHLTRPDALDPQAAGWLNLTPDHLERHRTMENYAEMKRRLFLGQGPQQVAVFFADDDFLRQAAPGIPGRLIWFGHQPERLGPQDILIRGERLLLPGASELLIRNRRLAGAHNAENAACAAALAMQLGLTPAAMQAGLDDYPGLPHRLEPVAEINGVLFIDDSKGTNIDATSKSLGCFEQPIVLIAGGRGKGAGYEPLRPLVSQRVRQLVLIGEEAEKMERELAGCAPATRAGSMQQAVELAYSLARPGDVVLLSPACASFDMFRDYAHRGEVFRQAVLSLREVK